MPIRRLVADGKAVYGRVKSIRRGCTYERAEQDTDFAWTTKEGGSYRIYVLDKHEWFDRRTSSKPKHHRAYGPGIVVCENSQGGYRCVDHHVNDPSIWSWICRCIKEGYINPQTIEGSCDERDVEKRFQ